MENRSVLFAVNCYYKIKIKKKTFAVVCVCLSVSLKKFQSFNSRKCKRPSFSLQGNLIYHFFLNVLSKFQKNKERVEMLSSTQSQCPLIKQHSVIILSRNYRLIVAPRKFDVRKTNICPRSQANMIKGKLRQVHHESD